MPCNLEKRMFQGTNRAVAIPDAIAAKMIYIVITRFLPEFLGIDFRNSSIAENPCELL